MPNTIVTKLDGLEKNSILKCCFAIFRNVTTSVFVKTHFHFFHIYIRAKCLSKLTFLRTKPNNLYFFTNLTVYFPTFIHANFLLKNSRTMQKKMSISIAVSSILCKFCHFQHLFFQNIIFRYHKALLVGDSEIAGKILKETDPRKMKRLGRQLSMSKKQLEE